MLPTVFDGGDCGGGTGAGSLQREDLRDLQLVPGHARRPIWVLPSGRIIFETFHPRVAEVTDFLMVVAEPVSRPEVIHEYQLTILSLSAAVSTGIDIEQVIKVLLLLSKNVVEDAFLQFIRSKGQTIGKTKLILRNNRHYLEAENIELLRRLCAHPDIAQSVVRQDVLGPDGRLDVQRLREGAQSGADQSDEVPSLEIHSNRVEEVKAAAHRQNLPLLQEYDYRQDRSDRNPVLHAHVRPEISVRAHQLAAMSKVFAVDGVAKSGIIVLPCGAGKTLTGISTCCRIGRRSLILTSTAVAVDQWRRQFLQFTTIAPEDIYMLTADSKRPIEDCERRACVLISTYSMLGFTGKRSGDAEILLSQIQQLEWGIMVVDEVQVMPAKTFRTVATTVKAHCSLGLTATLVREDNLVHDLHWLIGPKLYEASWQQLQDDGFLARVRCVEVWCEMSKAFFAEYLRSMGGKEGHLRRALWTCNPNKLIACEYLIRFHEQRGDKTIVFSDNIFLLEDFAKRLGRYYISGKVEMRERMQILSNFQNSSTCNTIFLSKVGDNAIDIPNASVIVQISSHYGSRRQEAQRLGRILRPKPKAFDATSKFNAFFYTLVSRDTQEMYYASRRQQFLVEQGYNYHILRDESVSRMDDKSFHYSSEDAQLRLLKQVLESVRRGETVEAEEDEVPLYDPTAAPGRPATAAAAPSTSGAAPMAGGAAASSRGSGGVVEEKFSLASLSGGLDGSYAVTSKDTKRKFEDTF
mmetsp:Transcript_117042/g.372631  ORF Transcript_117042/g.372631 Transcript_117042/m.372631 type:complete len:748 (+) Transcript_117042:594-2837(+)